MMKKINFPSLFISLFLMIFTMSACKKENMPSKPQPSPFSVSLEIDSSVAVDGGTANLLIEAGSNGWWVDVAEESASWSTINRRYGSGDYKLPVVLKENTTGQPRSTSVTVNPTFDLPAITIIIKQD